MVSKMITFSNVRPHPLKEMPQGINPNSGVFATECRFEKGKNYLVTAPSGKGKSTLVHIIYGLRKDYDGSVQVSGKDIQAFSPDDWAERRQRHFSVVFQDLRLFSGLTALENILLKSGLTGETQEEEVRKMAAELGVIDVLENSSETLSYGQRQRVAIIRALCQPFDFLLLDEPFSHLDDENIRRTCRLIQEKCDRQQAGFLLTSFGERYFFKYDLEVEL